MNFTTEQQMVLGARRQYINCRRPRDRKDAVLTERIVRRVRQELVDIDNVLVLTYRQRRHQHEAKRGEIKTGATWRER